MAPSPVDPSSISLLSSRLVSRPSSLSLVNKPPNSRCRIFDINSSRVTYPIAVYVGSTLISSITITITTTRLHHVSTRFMASPLPRTQ